MRAMSTTAEAIRKLLLAHFKGDDAAFRAAAWDFVEKERSLNHHTLVKDLERILSGANGSADQRKDAFATLGALNGNLPRDKERNALLVELYEPRRELEDLVLCPSVRQTLDRIVLERRKEELLGAHGVRPIGKVLFCGPPGCGKSVAAEALARELYLPLATVRFDAVVSSYLGETAANLRKVFDFARPRPLVLFFDEFDAIGKHRTAFDEHGELKRVVNSFLQLLDSFRSDALTVAATNHQGLLDPALWRRFDEIVFFPKPTPEEIEALLCRHFRQLTVSRSVRLGEVACGLEGFSHADVERVAQDAIKQSLLSGKEQIEPEVLAAAATRQRDRQAVTDDAAGVPQLKPKRARTRRRKAD
jgi:SpoVK/Ycf46/Vps4 family AAA+-type ATPase